MQTHQPTNLGAKRRTRKIVVAVCGGVMLMLGAATMATAATPDVNYTVTCDFGNGDIDQIHTSNEDRVSVAVGGCINAGGSASVKASS